MGINELEKVVRGAAREKDLHSIITTTESESCEEKTLSPEFAQAAMTLALRKGKKRVTAVSLLSPATGLWL